MVHQWGFFGSISAIRKIWSLTANSRSLQAAALKKQRNFVTTLKRKSIKSYFIQASAECAHPGEFWKKFKPLLPSKCAHQQNNQLLEEGR